MPLAPPWGAVLLLLLCAGLAPGAGGQRGVTCGNKQNVFTPGRVECGIQLTAPPVESPWGGRAGGREGATGFSAFAAPEKKPRLNWKVDLHAGPFGLHSPVLSGDGSIYFASPSGHVWGYTPNGVLMVVVDVQSKLEGVAAVWGNVLLVTSSLGLHLIDTRGSIPSSTRMFYSWQLPGGIVSSPAFVAHDTSAPKTQDHGPAIYVTALDQHVYKLALKGDCNGLLSEPCISMTTMVVWKTHIEFTPESEPFYTLQDDRCTAPFKLDRTVSLKCVKCKRQIPCDRSCLDCEDQTIGGYNPLRSSPVLYGELLYVVAWDGLHALKRSSGERAWHHFIVLDSKVEQDERYYVGTSYHRQRLMALSCVVVSDIVIFSSAGTVVCLNRQSGLLKWRIRHPRNYDYISTPVVYRFKDSTREADAVLISSMDGKMYCLDLDTGSTLWSYSTGVENVTQALAPIVDSYSNIYLLERDKLTALDKSGSTLWNEDRCAGSGILSSPAISREGMISVACNDSSLRLYCCRTCEATEAVPRAGSPFNSNGMAVNVTVQHRMLWDSEKSVGKCRMGSQSWPVRRINDTLVECQIPTLKARLDDETTASIILKQHTVLYSKCYANSSSGPIEVPCSYLDDSAALFPVCRERIEDEEIQFSNSSLSANVCQGCQSCTKLARLDVDLGISYIGNESCLGQIFTYFFPIIVVQNETAFPAKLPKDYTPLIINLAIAGFVLLVAFFIYIWVRYKINQYLEELEDQKVEEMAAFLNSPDLDPHTKKIILIAKNRLQNAGNGLIEAWEKWRNEVDEAYNTRIFLKVGRVKTQEEYEKLLRKHHELRDADKLWTFVWSQLNKGEATWISTRRIMDVLTSFSPYWGDLWSCYLEVEIESFRKKLRRMRRLKSFARRGETVWTKNHDHFENKRQRSWMVYHKHSLTTGKGFSSICKSLTKDTALPISSVGLGAPLGNGDEEITFVYFGDTGAIGIGVANESIPLQIKPHETGRDQKAWYFASGASQEPYSTVTGEIKVIIVEARNLRSADITSFIGLMQYFGVGFGMMRPFAQLSTNSSVGEGLPREWKTPTSQSFNASFPEWNEEFRICLRGNELSLRLEVYHDARPRPVLLGSARIPLNLLKQASCKCWVPIFNGIHHVGDVLLQTSYSVPIEEIIVTQDEAEAKIVFRTLDADAGERGLIDSERLHNQLTLLGYPSEIVDEMMYIADRRCVGKISYMQYWNALLPHIFENHIRRIASTLHPIFRSEEALPELDPITPPKSPQPDAGDFSRLPSSSLSRLPSAASIASAVSHAAQQLVRVMSPASQSRPGSPETVNGPQDAEGHSEHALPEAAPQTARDELGQLAEHIMKRSMLFYALDFKVTRAFLRHAAQLTLQPGEYLYSEDEEVPCISIVRSGCLILYRPAEEEGTIGEAAMHAIKVAEESEPELQAFGRLEAGDIIGEMNCLFKEACSVVFRAETKTRLLQIPRRDLFKMLPRKSREFFDPPDVLESPLGSPLARGSRSPVRPGRGAGGAAKTLDEHGSVPPPPDKKDWKVHKSGGAMYEGGMCIAKNLPTLRSGDRVRIKVDRGFGQLRVWINEHELSTTIAGFQGELRPMVYLTGKGASCTMAERKERVIRCVVVAAEGLPKTDFITGMADPYVKIRLTSVQAQGAGASDLPVVHTFRTNTVRCSLTPEWNESFILTPYNLEDRLDLEVWDYDVVDEDDIMGTFSCHVGDIISHCNGAERWYSLRNKENQPAGKLCLRFEVSEPTEEQQKPKGLKLFRTMSYQQQARMRRPRLKDLPDCLVPDPALIRALFQRCFRSKLTVPQIRYFFQLWEDFESEVLGETSQEHKAHFIALRDLVWQAVQTIEARHPKGPIRLPEVRHDANGHPDLDKTPRIWLAIEGVFRHPRAIALQQDNRDVLNRMAVFKAKGSVSFNQGGLAASVHQRQRPVAGASLFFAPGALSGLMRPLTPSASKLQKQVSLKAQWLKNRPPSSQGRRTAKNTRTKTAHFAEDASLVSIRQTAHLDDKHDADDLVLAREGTHARSQLLHSELT